MEEDDFEGPGRWTLIPQLIRGTIMLLGFFQILKFKHQLHHFLAITLGIYMWSLLLSLLLSAALDNYS